MSDIFISHAAADQKLAALFTAFLKEAIGVPSGAIFCSSVPGHDIPLGLDFNTHMKNEIQAPKLVFLLMTPSYMESAFCLMELGAAWAKSHKTLPVVVPPVSFDMVTKTLGLVQAWGIEKHNGLVGLRKAVVKSGIVLEKRSEEDWDDKRREWKQDLKKVVSKLEGAKSVPAAEHDKVLSRLNAAKETVVDLKRQLSAASATIEKLAAAKDKAEVRAVKRELSGAEDIEEEFEGLLTDVNKALPSASREVRLHIIMDHYDKAPRIDWSNYGQDFEDAVQRKLIDHENGYAVLWGGAKLSRLRKALKAVDEFLDSREGAGLMDSQEDGIPMEADDRDFWEYHLN